MALSPGFSPATAVQLRHRLQQSGLSALGVEQVVSGNIVTDLSDRMRVARLLVDVLGPGSSTAADRVHDWNKAQELRTGRP